MKIYLVFFIFYFLFCFQARTDLTITKKNDLYIFQYREKSQVRFHPHISSEHLELDHSYNFDFRRNNPILFNAPYEVKGFKMNFGKQC